VQNVNRLIEDFVFFENDWMRKEFDRLEFVRSQKYVTFKAALNLLLQNGGKIIVETGTQRMIDDPGGCSTLLFGAFCERYKRQLITVDYDSEHIETSKVATAKYKDYVTYVLMDSVAFLSAFDKPIDLLYLDSLDCPEPPADATAAQTQNLKELKAAYHRLHKGSILLIDDNDFENGGKSRLSKKFLLETAEWQCLLDHGQTVWIKVS
jgi:predicted O-methyltransferase YrrM